MVCISNLSPDNGYPNWHALGVSAVQPGKWWDSRPNSSMAISFHILFDSFLTKHQLFNKEDFETINASVVKTKEVS